MKKLKLKKLDIDYKRYIKKSASEDDCKKLITEECCIEDDSTGELIALYCKPQNKKKFFGELWNACIKTKFQHSNRLSGIISTSRIFGYSPRSPRKNFCSSTSLMRQQRQEHGAFVKGGKIASEVYQTYNTSLHEKHSNLTEQKVKPEFTIKETPFTSGIVNDNNPLCYHFDAGNYKNVWSAMIVMKKGIKQGHLSLPEYGVKVEVADNSIFFFDGQNIMHGVTPIIKTSSFARRFSIVYYSLQRMWSCLPMGEEIARSRQLRTKMETKGYVSAFRKKKNENSKN